MDMKSQTFKLLDFNQGVNSIDEKIILGKARRFSCFSNLPSLNPLSPLQVPNDPMSKHLHVEHLMLYNV